MILPFNYTCRIFLSAYLKSVDMICFSSDVPEEYVDAIVDAHCSEYHGMFSFCDVELMETERIYLT